MTLNNQPQLDHRMALWGGTEEGPARFEENGKVAYLILRADIEGKKYI